MSDRSGRVVTDVAHEMNRREWTNGEAISLASKVAFLYRPMYFPPLDSYGRDGIKVLNARLKASDHQIILSSTKYEDYLRAFNWIYRRCELSIQRELERPWVVTLAVKLRCPPKVLRKRAFKRKVLDNMLMIVGGREGRW